MRERLAQARALEDEGTVERAIEAYGRIAREPRANVRERAVALDRLAALAWLTLDAPLMHAAAEQLLSLPSSAEQPEAFEIFLGQATVRVQLGDPAGASAILERAEAASGDASIDAFASYLSVKADVLAALGRPAAALDFSQLACDIAERRNDPRRRVRRRVYLAYALHQNGRIAEAFDHYVRAAHAADACGAHSLAALARARAAWLGLHRGAIAEATALAHAGYATPAPEAWPAATRAWIGIFVAGSAGDDELLGRATEVPLLEAAIAGPDRYSSGPALAALATLHARAGRLDAARALLERVPDVVPAADCAWPLFAPAVRYGSERTIAYAAGLLAAFPRSHPLARANGRLFEALRLRRAGATAESERIAGEARLAFEDIGCAFDATLALELSGRVAEARARFARMGARGETARLAGAAARRGRPRRSYEAGAQRREILALVREGRTTAQIADRFGVTPRTIKNRLTELYDEYGVSSRAELLAVAAPAPKRPGERNAMS